MRVPKAETYKADTELKANFPNGARVRHRSTSVRGTVYLAAVMRRQDDQGRIYYEPNVLVYWEEGEMGIFRTLPEDLEGA